MKVVTFFPAKGSSERIECKIMRKCLMGNRFHSQV